MASKVKRTLGLTNRVPCRRCGTLVIQTWGGVCRNVAACGRRTVKRDGIVAGQLRQITYRTRDLGQGREEGVIDATWNGEIDTWGKYTLQTGKGACYYLFADEIVTTEPVDPPTRAVSAKHTPGPWSVTPLRARVSVSSIILDAPYTYEVPIAYLADDPLTRDAADANARLIAAAPELANLLRETVRALTGHVDVEATRLGVKPETLCPCHEEEIARAHALLAHIDGE